MPGYQPRSAPLPPIRKWWVVAMPPEKRLTTLIVEHLEGFYPNRSKSEGAIIKGFLANYAKSRGAGVELMVKKARGDLAVIYAHIPDVGVVRWLPSLVVPWNGHFDRMRRECGLGMLQPHAAEKEPERDAFGNPIPRKPPKTDKVPIQLVHH